MSMHDPAQRPNHQEMRRPEGMTARRFQVDPGPDRVNDNPRALIGRARGTPSLPVIALRPIRSGAHAGQTCRPVSAVFLWMSGTVC